MLIHISYSLLWLGVFQQGTTAGPVHTRRDPRPAEPTPINGQMQGGLSAPWPPSQIEWPFEKTESTKWTKENPPKDGDKPPDSEEGGEVHTRNEISRAFIDKSCTEKQHRLVMLAWEEARALADAQSKIKDGYTYNIPHTQWLGKDWNTWYWFGPDFGARNRDKFSRLKAVFSKNAPKNDYLFFECNDPKKACIDNESGFTVAYSYSEEGLWWTNHYINFCPRWQDMDWLEETLERFKDNKHEQKVIEDFERSIGVAMFRQIWTLKNLISKEKLKDYASGAQASWDLAKDKGTWWATENVDSYTLDAIAIHAQQRFSSSMSPVPRDELKKLDAEAFKNTKEPSKKEKHMYQVLPDSKEAPKDHPKIADKKDWKEVTFDLWPETEKPKEDEDKDKDKPDEPKEEPIKCYKASDDKYVIRDKFVGEVDEFCDMAEKQGHPDTDSRSISRKRFSGTVNELSITIDWEPGLDFKPNSKDCKRIMREIADSCDVPDQYKGGGEKYVGKVKYQWQPETTHKFWAGCEWQYKALHNSFQIWGAGWSKDGGKELEKRVKATGIAATSFEHKWGGGKDDREWTATFSTIIGTAGKVEGIIEDLVGHDVDVWCRQTAA